MNIQLTMDQVKESYKLINAALNKSCKAGVYTLDEAYIIKVASSNIEKFIESNEEAIKTINNIKSVNKTLFDENNEKTVS